MNFNCTSQSEIFTPRLFIEASAGTGKTFVIEHYVIRTILNANETPCDPKKFALITFTRAASRELFLRLKKSLSQARSYFLGEPLETVPEYFLHYSDTKKAAKALTLFLEQLDHACISTIHGFCEKLLTLWQEATGEEGGGWIGEHQQKIWLKEFLREQSFITPHEWILLGTKDRYNSDHFLKKLILFLEDPAIQSTPTTEDIFVSIRESIQFIKNTFPEMIENTFSIFSEYAKQFRGNCTKEGVLHKEKEELFTALHTLFQEKEIDPFSLHIQLTSLFETPLRKHSPLKERENAFVTVVLEKLAPHLSLLIDPESIRQRIAKQAARSFFDYIDTTKKKTPEALIKRVLLLTRNDLFCQLVASHFSWVVVDEFQDTDASQFTIFSKLFISPSWPGNILFVGDPKQAIYAFRKADVYSYIKAKDLLQKDLKTLTINYRATKDVVEAINTLFTSPVFHLPKDKRMLPYLPCEAHGSLVSPFTDTRGALHCVVFSGSMGKRRSWPHEDIERKFLEWMHDEIIEVSKQAIPLKNQAILVRDRYQAKRVEEFLQSKKIPTCSWRVDLVTDSQAYSFLKSVFSLLSQPTNQKRVLSLLFTFPEKGDLCKKIVSEGDLAGFALVVSEWKKVKTAFLGHGIGGFSRQLFSCHIDGSEPFSSFLSKRGKEFTIDLEHLLELLASLEPFLPRDIDAFGCALNDLEGHFSKSSEKLLRRVDPDDKGIPILTLHKSKGLEFDVIYALGASSRTPQDEEGDYKEIDAEKLRQIYVALTRAKARIYLPLFLDEDEKEVTYGQASPTELLLSCLHIGERVSPESFPEMLYPAITPTTQRDVIKRLADKKRGVISCSENEKRSFTYQPVQEPDKQQLILPPLHGTGLKTSSFSKEKRKRQESLFVHHRPHNKQGALLGIRFHREIASLLCEGDKYSQEYLEKKTGKELGDLLFHALHVNLPYKEASIPFSTVPRGNIRTEVPFAFMNEEGECVNGVIDLLFLHEGKVFLLDWKTQEVDTPLSPYIIEEGYDIQYTLYKRASLEAFPQYEWGGFFFVFVRNLAKNKQGVVFL